MKITTKSFDLLPVYYCQNVRNCRDGGDFNEEDENIPHCENVVCATCSLPDEKRDRSQRKFSGFNGLSPSP